MAVTDVLTEGEVIAALAGIDAAADTVGLMYASAVSDRLDQLCGNIVARDVTEIHDGGSATILLDDRPHNYLDEDDEPVAAIASISVRDGSVTTAVNLDHVVVYTPAGTGRGVIDYVTGLGFFRAGRRAVTVTYRAGRFDTTEDVDPIFKLAAVRLLQGIWRPAESAGPEGVIPLPPTVLPDEVAFILGNELRIPTIA